MRARDSEPEDRHSLPRAAATSSARASRRAPLRAAALAGACVAALASAGCASIVSSLPEMDWNPLIRVEHRPGGATEVEALGPLIDLRAGPEGFSHAVRPFYQHKQDGPV